MELINGMDFLIKLIIINQIVVFIYIKIKILMDIKKKFVLKMLKH
jgi:hypothetical protein